MKIYYSTTTVYLEYKYKMNSQVAILYFPKKTFSHRFGEKFFTFEITKYTNDDINDYLYCCYSQATFYHILVSCGKDSWSIRKRYSDFVNLRGNIIQDISKSNSNSDIPILPPKTFISIINDETSLLQRKELLEQWLQTLLEYLSSNHLLQLKCIRNFLGFIENEDTFTD